MELELQQFAWAGAAISAWAALTLGIYIRTQFQRRDAEPAEVPVDDTSEPATLVLWASQTGFAEDLALRTGRALRDAGVNTRILPLATITNDQIVGTKAALIIASTTGEGDAPDGADRFLQRDLPALQGLEYALLALGDSSYVNYCGFGHKLDRLLRAKGAHPLTDMIEVDNGDVGALHHWQQQLWLFGGSRAEPDWAPPEYGAWRLVRRDHLNPGSAGKPAYHIRLEPQGDLPNWIPGAIAEIYPGPAEPILTGGEAPTLPHREYSIASLPGDGGIELVIRLRHLEDGTYGLGSGWLCNEAPIGAAIGMRLRANSGFAPPADDVPMILIGNGTGIAGLRAHIKARPAGTRNWLIFGERNSAHDSLLGTEIAEWIASGHLERCDLVFSRDGEGPRYVADQIDVAQDEILTWVMAGGAIYVCGSLSGMAGDVDTTLARILDREILDDLVDQGRYRRDVY
ncbi:sulfite reductase subunit alpha [Sphingomonas montanisoli]|uniref:NADPH--hemoprotein reductase n=1 Tax=Sphingomonas montanisoli TaxID=2606412 RepID=A0A5D9CCI3_9SPHN|nr:sulfite reductase subunit alpha [Sphingomonas montanisoli]TZG27805.1 oxidoreductase [Sphingomonas montanisoli]